MSLLRPSELRARAGVVLAPATDTDPDVIDGPVDAVHPPCYVLEWNDPWLEFQTPSFWYAQIAVVCVTGRLDPMSGTEDLETMAADVISRFKADAYTWPQASAAAPRQLDIAGVSYLAARIAYRAPVTLNGGTVAPPPPPGPAPVLTRLNPDSAGDWNVGVQAVGDNFTDQSKIVSGSTVATPTFVSATELQFVVPGVVAAGVYQVKVRNPDGQESGAVPFTAL